MKVQKQDYNKWAMPRKACCNVMIQIDTLRKRDMRDHPCEARFCRMLNRIHSTQGTKVS